MIRIVTVIMALGIFCIGCKAKKEVTVQKTESTAQENKSKEETSEKCTDGKNDLIWNDVTAELTEKNELKMATDFKLFRIDGMRLQRVFEKNAKQNENGEFIIGVPIYKSGKVACTYFRLMNSGTIDQTTQVRMGVYSFKGEDVSNQQNTARIDFNKNVGLRAYFQLGEETFLLEPVTLNNQRIYISFNKKNSTSIKEQFLFE